MPFFRLTSDRCIPHIVADVTGTISSVSPSWVWIGFRVVIVLARGGVVNLSVRLDR